MNRLSIMSPAEQISELEQRIQAALPGFQIAPGGLSVTGGSFSQVYLATGTQTDEHSSHQVTYAIKEPQPFHLPGSLAKEVIEREYNFIQGNRHPGIARGKLSQGLLITEALGVRGDYVHLDRFRTAVTVLQLGEALLHMYTSARAVNEDLNPSNIFLLNPDPAPEALMHSAEFFPFSHDLPQKLAEKPFYPMIAELFTRPQAIITDVGSATPVDQHGKYIYLSGLSNFNAPEAQIGSREHYADALTNYPWVLARMYAALAYPERFYADIKDPNFKSFGISHFLPNDDPLFSLMLEATAEDPKKRFQATSGDSSYGLPVFLERLKQEILNADPNSSQWGFQDSIVVSGKNGYLKYAKGRLENKIV